MDLVIKNGTVVTSENTSIADIYVKDGKIAAILDKDQSFDFAEKNPVSKVIDASGKLVMPGGVDVHTHLDMPFMGTSSVDDFESGTISAIYGGVTSIIDYAIPEKNQSLIECLNIWHKKAKAKAYVDYGFHMSVVPPVEKVLDELKELVDSGITSIKCFFAYKNALMINDESFIQLLKKAKESGILVCVHAEDGEVIDLLTKKFIAENKTEPHYHALSRPAEFEEKSVEKILNFAESEDASIYFVHISTKSAIEKINKSKMRGVKVLIETCPQYLLLTDELYLKPNFEGAKYVMSPPLRSKKHLYGLVSALKQGQIDVIATDHCSFNFGVEKQLGKDCFAKIPNGIPGLETRMPLIFKKMVVEEGISLSDFVKINCTTPAKIFGLTSKGDIKIGYDADIVIWDATCRSKIKAANLHHKVDYNPYEGFESAGKIETVLLRGNVIMDNGNLVINSPSGKFIKREKIISNGFIL